MSMMLDEEIEVEGRELTEALDRRTSAPYPTYGPGDGRSWGEFAHELRAAGADERDVPPVSRTILRVSQPTGGAERYLGLGPRKVLKKARAAGWARVELHFSEVAVSDEYRAADSKKKPGEEAPEHRKGELKVGGHIERFWWIIGVQPAARIAFRAHWKEGVTPKGGHSFTFDGALANDPVGMPTEFFADYSIGAIQREKDEPGHVYESRLALLEAAARRYDRDYNDGTSWQNRRPFFRAYKPFDTWLDEAIELADMILTPRELADGQA